MYSPWRNYFVALTIILFVALGCNLGDLLKSKSDEEVNQNTEITKKKEDVFGKNNSKDTEDEADSEDTIPDMDFPKNSENTKETPNSSSGKKVTVVKFRKGGTARTYNHAVIRAESHTYILGAAKGQRFSVNIKSLEDNAGFYIKKPGGGFLGKMTESESGTNYSGTLPVSGKYRIIVAPTRGNATYRISFSVKGKTGTKPSSNSTTVESVGGLTTVVKFRKGSTSAIYKNAVIRAQRNKYILGAGKGQYMNVSISSLENNAVFDVRAPNGIILARETTRWSGRLSLTGKYRIIVGGTRGNATYTVRFSVR